MSISIPSADYSPQLAGYTGQGAFRFWCQKVLPIVYDDSLSYYELLNKVVNYLNNVISDVRTMGDNIDALSGSFGSLQDFVNTQFGNVQDEVNNFEDNVSETIRQFEQFLNDYFENLDVQEEINNKLDEMALNGDLTALISPLFVSEAPAIISAWLAEHITPTSPAVDSSLSVGGAAADAKVVGDAFEDIIAEKYSESESYSVGDYVLYDEKLYKCTTDISGGEIWNSNHWWNVDTTDEVTNLKNAMENGLDGFREIEWTRGGYISNSDGSVTEYDSWSYSDYIDISKFTGVKSRFGMLSNYNAVYDASRNFLRAFQLGDGTTVNFNPDEAYLRVSIRTSLIWNSFLKLLPDELEKVATEVNVMSDGLKKVDWIAGGYIDLTDGSVVEFDTWSYSDYIDVSRYTGLRSSFPENTHYNAAYDANKNFLRAFWLGPDYSAVTLGSEVAFIRVSIRTIKADMSYLKFIPEDMELALNELDAYGANFIKLTERVGSSEYPDYHDSGVDFTWGGNTVHAEGTAINGVSFRIFEMSPYQTENTGWIKPNHTYWLELERSSTDSAVMQVKSYINNTLIDEYTFTRSGSFTLHQTDEINYLYIQAVVPSGATVDNILTYKLLDSPPLQEILSLRNTPTPTSSEPQKIRVIQNNVGCWRWGRTQSTLDPALTTSELTRNIKGYKRFFGDFLPDVVCLQEYVSNMGDGTNPAKSTVFDPLFRNAYISSPTSGGKSRAIFTNLDCEFGSEDASDDSATVSWIYAHLTAKNTYVVTLAFHPQEGESGVTFRMNQLELLMDAMDQLDNVIICADLNVHSDAELTSFLTYMQQHDFHGFCNGDYWGRDDTYMNPANQATPQHYYRKIDNIMVKGDIKMVNGKVLFDETTDYPDTYVLDPDDVDQEHPYVIDSRSAYNKLASDHIPVMADLYIY